ncbi:hypothetical protein [Salinibacter ruber]|uniref:Uncharacterized protein n=1 Tax=Salinibacter ruber TaxID=146919 RepID=A0AAW5PBD7_9BACT|nr:hypothetical protein [Salinibacter ruber]MCS4159506.1 hypothetical protein [Salinibacter ruber]
MPQLSQEPEGGSVREALKRYARLEEAEIRRLRDTVEGLPDSRSRVMACDFLLNWHPEAEGWNWDKICGNPSLSKKARALTLALTEERQRQLKDVLLRACNLLSFEEAAYEAGLAKLERDLMGSEPAFGDLKEVEEASRESAESYHTIYRSLRRAGWPGIEGGSREGLEKLTQAITMLNPPD